MKPILREKLLPGRLLKLLIALTIFVCSSFAFQPAHAQTGEALNFDGVDDYVDLPFIVQNSYTKEAWINLPVIDGGIHNIISGSQTALYVINGQLTAGHYPNFSEVQDPTPLVAGTWYHVSVTYDVATGIMTLYKNGTMVSSALTPTYVETENYIGALYVGAAGYFFQGTIDEVRFWDVAQSAAFIAADANCSLVGTEPNLTAYYNFNQGTAGGANPTETTLADNSGNTQDGVLMNFALTGATSNWIAPGAPLTGPCSPLPIELSYFAAEKSGAKISLVWKTSSEHNNAGFTIERSENGTTGWTNLGFIKGAGNSSREITYKYSDLTPLKGSNFYRLKQSDFDGTPKYSFVRNAKFDGNLKAMLLYPSITRNKVTIELSDNQLLNTQLFVLDNQGRVVKKETITQMKQDVDVNSLQNGMYFIKTEKGDTEKFIKQ
ncbi:MAG: LamG-like jellyroll fold domain-containing protein [Ginsengibacter sp.]